MAKRALLLDFSAYDLNRVVADIEEIRRYNPQRYEMEHLTAICHEDAQSHLCVGYKDLGPNEFWARGHFPGLPLMPGVIMCEAAAQLASYYSKKFKLMDGVVGFGGLEEVRFRGLVRPGDRFVIVCRLLKVRRMIMTAEFQCFVNQNLVCEGIVKGVALPVDQITGELPPGGLMFPFAGENGELMNLRLHLAAHAIVERQLAADEPKGVAAIARELEKLGVSRHNVRHAIGRAVMDQMWKMGRNRTPFDERAYFAGLRKIVDSYR